MPVSKKRKPKRKTGSNKPAATFAPPGITLPKELRSLPAPALEAILKVKQLMKSGSSDVDLKTFAALFSRGAPLSTDPRDLALAAFVRKNIDEMSVLVSGDIPRQADVLPGYAIYFDRSNGVLTQAPFSGMARNLEDCCVPELMDELAAIGEGHDAAFWFASGPRGAYPTAIVAADLAGGRVAFLYANGKLEQLSSLSACREYLFYKYSGRGAEMSPEYMALDELQFVFTDVLGVSEDVLREKVAEFDLMLRHVLDLAQVPYFQAAMDFARELRYRNLETATEIDSQRVAHAKAVEDLKARAAESSARLQGLFEKASARANAAEHQLRELKSRGADAVVVSSGGVCGASLGERLAAIF